VARDPQLRLGVVAAVDRLARRIRRLERLAVELQELATDLTEELAIVLRTLRADASGRLDAAIEVGILRKAQARRRAELRSADAGAAKMEMRLNRAGAALVRIDEGQWFRLSRADARLLHVLARAAAAEDAFPAWLTYDELAEKLGRKTGVAPTRRAVVESVYRLRRALESADLNPYLLKVDRKAGRLRFLLKSDLGDAPAHGPH
jgi:hypothetical protein